MRCADVREWLAAADGPRVAAPAAEGAARRTREGSPAGERPGDVEAHLSGCPACGAYAARTARVDALARTRLIVEPPAELQMRLMELVNTSYLPVVAPGPVPAGDARTLGWGPGAASAAEEAARRARAGSA